MVNKKEEIKVSRKKENLKFGLFGVTGWDGIRNECIRGSVY